MPNTVECKRLRRKDASVYLRERWNIERAHSTLAKLATIGGGPRFVLVGRIPLYPESELDLWAQSITSPLLSSTSDRSKPARIPSHETRPALIDPLRYQEQKRASSTEN